MSLSAIILAAGKSTRMKSDLPKPLHPVCGRPMLSYILQAAWDAGAERCFVVVGHGKEQVMATFDDDRIEFVEQKQQLGTGHAARVCLPGVEAMGTEDHDVIILAGDVPLVRGELLQTLVTAHRESGADASMATAELDDPFGYGRVIRDDQGQFQRIVEQADATPEEAAVREVFPSLYCVKAATLVDVLGKLKNENKKGEYYLTDLFEIARQGGGRVLAVKCVEPDDIIAPNTRGQLAEANRAMQRRIVADLFDQGVSVVDPATTFIEADVEVGRETIIEPFTFIGRGARIGAGCRVGPFAHVPVGGIVKDGVIIAGNVDTSVLSDLSNVG